MKHLRRIFLKFYLLFANSKAEADLAKKIGAHLALLEDEYLRQGMPPEDARRAARLAYGGSLAAIVALSVQTTAQPVLYWKTRTSVSLV
jgi:hypothetical protein